MARYLKKEDGGLFQLEDSSGYILLELDWINEPGTVGSSWAPASDTNGASWTPVDGGSNNWTREDGS